MKTGRIEKLIKEKEYGMIRGSSGKEVLFHKQCLWDIPFHQLSIGQEVEYELQTSYNGYLGFHVRLRAEDHEL